MDHVACLAGMLTALLVQQYPSLTNSLLDLWQMTVNYPRRQQSLAVFGVRASATLFLVAYVVFPQNFQTRDSSISFHTVTSFIPIILFVYIRNCTHWLRTHYSIFFAWFGGFSLETYILQYHVLLAADTYGILQLGMLEPWKETLLITLLFVWGSSKVSQATNILTRWIIEDNNRCLCLLGCSLVIDLRLRLGLLLFGSFIGSWLYELECMRR